MIHKAMKQNSFKRVFFFPSFLFLFPHQVRTAAGGKVELTAVFAVQSDLLKTEGRKDKRKQKHCWSLSTGRA